jgi:hypothetical protein
VPPQFFWLWTPCNFDGFSLYLHTNDDAHGRPWNRRAVLWRDIADAAWIEAEEPVIDYDWHPETRRVRSVRVDLGPETRLTLTPLAAAGSARGHFYMNGLGYTHPVWGHGMEHGDLALAYDAVDLSAVADGDPANMHVQAIAEAVLEHDGMVHHGRGVVEQMFIGPHAGAGLTGLFDGHD